MGNDLDLMVRSEIEPLAADHISAKRRPLGRSFSPHPGDPFPFKLRRPISPPFWQVLIKAQIGRPLLGAKRKTYARRTFSGFDHKKSFRGLTVRRQNQIGHLIDGLQKPNQCARAVTDGTIGRYRMLFLRANGIRLTTHIVRARSLYL